ncbi:MAG: DUF3099 domain-containing protein [Actinobacteria bacterium]|nr:DUF3099 domain-containing protein [Actinomycetota bacterium]
MRRNPDASVTSLPRAPRDEAAERVRHYAITMGIRTICFILIFVVQPMGWWTWAFAIGAAVLPYIAVVFANAGDDSVETTVESPLIGLEAAPRDAASASPHSDVITVAESAARPSEQRP